MRPRDWPRQLVARLRRRRRRGALGWLLVPPPERPAAEAGEGEAPARPEDAREDGQGEE